MSPLWFSSICEEIQAMAGMPTAPVSSKPPYRVETPESKVQSRKSYPIERFLLVPEGGVGN